MTEFFRRKEEARKFQTPIPGIILNYLGVVTLTRQNLWRQALRYQRTQCRYCLLLVVTPEMGVPPNKTKLRWAIYRHLKSKHKTEFAAHFPQGSI